VIQITKSDEPATVFNFYNVSSSEKANLRLSLGNVISKKLISRYDYIFPKKISPYHNLISFSEIPQKFPGEVLSSSILSICIAFPAKATSRLHLFTAQKYLSVYLR
jgi:hypothetical protein